MYRNLFQFFLLSLFIAGCTPSTLKVMTYNIRLDIDSDGENRWDNRKEMLTQQVINLQASIIGTQEGRPSQIMYLDQNLGDYSRIGTGRDGGNKGEYTAIYYETDRFELHKDSTFWLSETPGEYSLGWDSAYPRICTFGLFTDNKTKQKFFVVNTHLDNVGVEARRKGIDLLLKVIDSINSERLPIILMGDFNVEPESTLIQNLNTKMLDTYIAAKTSTNVGTFNAFNTNEEHLRRIDYIFISNNNTWKVLNYNQPVLIKNGRYPSDHFPVVATIKMN